MTKKDAYDLFKRANELFKKLDTDQLEAVNYGFHGVGTKFKSISMFNGIYDGLENDNQQRLELMLGKLVNVCTAIDKSTLRFKIKDTVRDGNNARVYFEDNVCGDTRFFMRSSLEMHNGMGIYEALADYYMKGGIWIFPKYDDRKPKQVSVITDWHTEHDENDLDYSCHVSTFFKPEVYVYQGGYLIGTRKTEKAIEGIKKFKEALCGQFVKDANHLPIRAIVEQLLNIGYDKAKKRNASASVDKDVSSLRKIVGTEI